MYAYVYTCICKCVYMYIYTHYIYICTYIVFAMLRLHRWVGHLGNDAPLGTGAGGIAWVRRLQARWSCGPSGLALA